MAELDQRVLGWRRAIAKGGAMRASDLDELCDHLRCTIEHRLARGIDTRTAFHEAVDALGDPDLLRAEFEKERPPMSLASKLFGVTLTTGLLALAIGRGDLPAFVHLPSALVVLGLVFGGLATSFGLPALGRAFRISLGRARTVDPAERASLVQLARRGYRLAWSSGLLGTILGIVQMLLHVDDPSRLGRGLATCMLSLLYGAMVAELVFAHLGQWLAARPVPPIELEA